MQLHLIHNADKAVTPKFFRDQDKLYVTSCFRTIQGEGIYSGRTAVFLRLAGCNFGKKDPYCEFCDSSFQIDKAMILSVHEVVRLILAIRDSHTEDILVITGGEPTLQPLILEVLKDLELQGSLFDIFQFESNGTNPEFATKVLALDDALLSKISFGVSPKANYRTKQYAEPSPEVMKLVELTGFLKFVVSADPENPHHTLPTWALDIPATAMTLIYVSPMAVYKKAPQGEVASIWDTELVDHQATASNYEYAAQYVLHHDGLLLSLQTHLFCAVA